MLHRMSIGNWFKRIFSSPAGTDAPADVAAETNDEIDINEARIDAGGGSTMRGGEYAGMQADSVAEGELSEEEPPSDPAP